MKIKKYLVKTVDDALSRIKHELGGDAYILSTKKVVKKGSLNLNRSEMIEVTAAVDKVTSMQDSISTTLLNKKYGLDTAQNHKSNTDTIAADERPVFPVRKARAINDKHVVNEKRSVLSDLKSDSPLQDELMPLRQEVEEIKRLLRKSDLHQGPKGIEFQGEYLEIFLDLMENGVERGIATKIVNTLYYQTKGSPNENKKGLKKRMFQILSSLIGSPSPIKLEPGKRKVICLVGPTGVGKTTTIAKLSSYYRLMESKKVALITNDTYRIGAEAHLSTYAKIINVPFYSVYSASDLKFRLNELKGYDLVFIDTTGRSSEDNAGLQRIQRVLEEIPADERESYLILSASTKTSDLKHIYKKYQLFQPDKLIFSKLDETVSLGNLMNLKMDVEMPIAYFTTGQQVPEDIEIAYPRRLILKVLNISKEDGGVL